MKEKNPSKIKSSVRNDYFVPTINPSILTGQVIYQHGSGSRVDAVVHHLLSYCLYFFYCCRYPFNEHIKLVPDMKFQNVTEYESQTNAEKHIQKTESIMTLDCRSRNVITEVIEKLEKKNLQMAICTSHLPV